jgi:cell division protein ZapA (FtsZ GTPase activity inhibitor)
MEKEVMAAINVSAELTAEKAKNAGVRPRSITVPFDFGSNLDEAIKLHGADIVYAAFVDSEVIRLQAKLRALMALKGDKSMTDQAIKSDIAKNWACGPQRKAPDPIKVLERDIKTFERYGLTEQLKKAQAQLKKLRAE